MSKSNTFENDLLLLLFNNIAIADIGDAAGLRATTTPGSLYWSLHTADPGEAGTAGRKPGWQSGAVHQYGHRWRHSWRPGE